MHLHSLSLQMIGDFRMTCDSSLVAKKCWTKEAYLAPSTFVAKFENELPVAISFYYQ